jgi:hypothetical protein
VPTLFQEHEKKMRQRLQEFEQQQRESEVSAPQQAATSAPAPTAVEDFPTLGSNRTSSSEKGGNVSYSAAVPAFRPRIALARSTVNDFPALGGGIGSGQSVSSSNTSGSLSASIGALRSFAFTPSPAAPSKTTVEAPMKNSTKVPASTKTIATSTNTSTSISTSTISSTSSFSDKNASSDGKNALQEIEKAVMGRKFSHIPLPFPAACPAEDLSR